MEHARAPSASHLQRNFVHKNNFVLMHRCSCRIDDFAFNAFKAFHQSTKLTCDSYVIYVRQVR